MFVCDKVAPNGANTRYHKAVKFEIHADATHAVVNSYHSETMEMISWQDTYTIPIVFKIETLADVETILTLSGAPFDGGVIVPDPDATIETAKARKWAETKLQRDLVINGGAPTQYGVMDSDETSRTNIAGAVLSAIIATNASQPFEVTWTLADNSTVTLDANQMVDVGTVVMSFVNACHEHARALRQQIDAAEDEAALAAIDITEGWPSNA